jgi:hypothetical protein
LGEWFFTLLWTFEMVVKMFLMGLRAYAANYKNLFDATITIVGLVSVAWITSVKSIFPELRA